MKEVCSGSDRSCSVCLSAVALTEAAVYTLYVGDKLELSCGAKGEPQEVNWTKDQVLLVNGEHTHLRNGALEIESVEPADSGLYACLARGPTGNHTEYFNVNVTGEDQLLEVGNVGKCAVLGYFL